MVAGKIVRRLQTHKLNLLVRFAQQFEWNTHALTGFTIMGMKFDDRQLLGVALGVDDATKRLSCVETPDGSWSNVTSGVRVCFSLSKDTAVVLVPMTNVAASAVLRVCDVVASHETTSGIIQLSSNTMRTTIIVDC